jgi:hypothetical protein
VVDYEELIDLALTSHNPFRAPGRGQYASLILPLGVAQLAGARAVAERFEAERGQKLATRIEPLARFYLAEDYHQKYYLRNDRALAGDFKAMFPHDEDGFRESTAAARVNGYVAGDGSKLQLEREIGSFGLTEQAARHLSDRASRGSWGGGCAL